MVEGLDQGGLGLLRSGRGSGDKRAPAVEADPDPFGVGFYCFERTWNQFLVLCARWLSGGVIAELVFPPAARDDSLRARHMNI